MVKAAAKLPLDFGTFYPKQTEFYNLVNASPATVIGYGGSRGGMKSYTARNVILMRRFQYPGTSACILRRTYDLVRENHIDPLLAQFPDLRKWYHVGDKELRLPGNTTIAFRYAETRGDVEAMIGKQYMDFLVDQAEQFTEHELNVMKSCRRWTGVKDSACKMIMTFNPGNTGHSFLKRIFYDKHYRDNEIAGDYVFLQAFGWDNVKWASAALAEDGLTEADYYGWDDKDEAEGKPRGNRRFNYFITRTQYGRELNALPQAMRIGWLLGRMDQFAGQYYDIFSPERHVRPCSPQEWHTMSIGIDWGFAHLSAAYWTSQIEPRLLAFYREFTASGRSPRALAQEIVDRTPENERRRIKHIFLSHDAFAKRTEQDTIAEQMSAVFRASGMPYPEQASKDPMGRAALLYDLLGPFDPLKSEYRTPEVIINPSCKGLIEVLPMVCRDQDHPEKPLKFDGDDCFDGATHCLTYRMSEAKIPDEMVAMQEFQKIDDPVARWFAARAYRQKHPANRPIAPRVIMPWEANR